MDVPAGLTQKILNLFKKQHLVDKKPININWCCFCGSLISSGAVELGVETVNILLQTLLVEIGDDETRNDPTWVCGKCSSSISSLVKFFLQLEILRKTFNKLRRTLGRQVILKSLGESMEVYEGWINIVKSVEDVFPSGGTRRLHQTTAKATETKTPVDGEEKTPEDLGNFKVEDEEMFPVEPFEFCNFFLDHLEEQTDDPKLTKMRPVVTLENLNGVSLKPHKSISSLTYNSVLPKAKELKVKSHQKTGTQPPEPNIPCGLTVLNFETSSVGKDLEDLNYDNESLPSPSNSDYEETPEDVNAKSNIPELLSRNLRPRKPLPVVLRADEDFEMESVDEFCPTESDSSSSEQDSNSGDPSDGDDISEEDTLSDRDDFPDGRNHNFKTLEEMDNAYMAAPKLTRNIPCGYCDLILPNRDNWLTHRHRNHLLDTEDPRTPKCSYCLRMFQRGSSLEWHLDVTHFGLSNEQARQRSQAKTKTLKWLSNRSKHAEEIHCSICDKMQKTLFPSLVELETHAETQAHLDNLKKKLNIHCNACRMQINGDVEALQDHLSSQAHLNQVQSLGKYKKDTFCIACRTDYSTPKDLAKHNSSKGHFSTCATFLGDSVQDFYRSKLFLQCERCPKKFSNRFKLRKHFNRHKQRSNVCEFCEKKFLTWRDLKSHRRTHDVPKLFPCPKCPRKFETAKLLTCHKSNSHSGASLMCPTCGKVFSQKPALNMHERTQHPKQGDETISNNTCSICSKQCQAGVSLRRHMYRAHKDETLKNTPQVCLVCFKGYKTPEDLNVHMPAHDTLKCPTCGKYFSMKINLENHIRTHTGEKPFGCTVCDKKFGARHNLQAHVRKHNAKKQK